MDITENILAVSYKRVSGKSQADGFGFDRQNDYITAFSNKENMQIVKEFKDVWTGTEEDRAGFSEMLQFCIINDVKHIIIESMDRFTRDQLVGRLLLSKLIERKISLWSATTGQCATEESMKDPMTKFIINLMMQLAELDKDLLVRKLREGRKASKKKNGRCEGIYAFGEHPKYPEEKVCLSQMLLLSEVGITCQEIATFLNNENYQTRNKRSWNRGTVWQIIKRLKMKKENNYAADDKMQEVSVQ